MSTSDDFTCKQSYRTITNKVNVTTHSMIDIVLNRIPATKRVHHSPSLEVPSEPLEEGCWNRLERRIIDNINEHRFKIVIVKYEYTSYV